MYHSNCGFILRLNNTTLGSLNDLSLSRFRYMGDPATAKEYQDHIFTITLSWNRVHVTRGTRHNDEYLK